MSLPALIVEHLSVAYKGAGRVLDDISLSVPEGTLCAVTGPSGCGKSTLLHVLSGIITRYDGRVMIHGAAPDPRCQSIGLVPQNYGLLPWKRVRDNILLPSRLGKKRPSPSDLQAVVEGLELGELLHRYPHELSGGQRQRVAIARAFVQEPELLLLDEPFSALDMLTAQRCRELFASMRARTGVTTIMVTHNVEEAVQMSDYIILLGGSPGRILIEGEGLTTEEVKQRLMTTET